VHLPHHRGRAPIGADRVVAQHRDVRAATDCAGHMIPDDLVVVVVSLEIFLMA
jgi:hypothetical protein